LVSGVYIETPATFRTRAAFQYGNILAMSSSMSFAWKRRCSFAVIAFYQFMGGIEYGEE
jgi:hypothetical protein